MSCDQKQLCETRSLPVDTGTVKLNMARTSCDSCFMLHRREPHCHTPVPKLSHGQRLPVLVLLGLLQLSFLLFLRLRTLCALVHGNQSIFSTLSINSFPFKGHTELALTLGRFHNAGRTYITHRSEHVFFALSLQLTVNDSPLATTSASASVIHVSLGALPFESDRTLVA